MAVTRYLNAAVWVCDECQERMVGDVGDLTVDAWVTAHRKQHRANYVPEDNPARGFGRRKN